MKLLLPALVGSLLCLLAGVSASAPSVVTALGKINGALCGDGNSAIASYLGIPYAEAPVGRLRWAAPYELKRKFPAAGLDATSPGPACWQGTEGDEDCLFLNVWAPANVSALRSRLPVRVFIHGGGFQNGKGTEDMYDGCKLANDGNVVFVTMNYRLGVMGFLALPELRDQRAHNMVGNWGLMDQRLALKWVQKNIAAFGGNPRRVVLTGESAGAYSTLMHMVMPVSRGLFSSALTFSGSADAMAVDFLKDAYAKGGAIRTALNCSGAVARSRGYTSSAACLRDTPAATVLEVQAALCTHTVLFPLPTIDGRSMPKHPVTLMEEGRAAQVPIVLGANANEGALEIIAQTGAATNIDVATFYTVINTLIRVAPSFNTRLYQQYDAYAYTGGSWLQAAINAITDGGYHCPSRRAARAFTAQGIPTRYFILELAKPNSGCPIYASSGVWLGQEVADFMGAYHGYDLHFSFMAPYRSPYTNCPHNANETQLSSFVSGIVNAVAASGSPLPPRTKSLSSATMKAARSWPVWNDTSNLVMDISTDGPTLLPADILLEAKCKLWDDILAADIAAGTSDHN